MISSQSKSEDHTLYFDLPVSDQIEAARGWLKKSLDCDQSFCRLDGEARDRLRVIEIVMGRWANAVQDARDKYEHAVDAPRERGFVWQMLVEAFRWRKWAGNA